jgi:hypothetical protein
MLLLEKAAEREALVALERFVKAMDAVGPASVRMCYVAWILYYETFEDSALLAHLVLEFYPTRECAGRRVILFHMFCEKQIVLIFSLVFHPFSFFVLPMTYVNNTICTQLWTAGWKN